MQRIRRLRRRRRLLSHRCHAHASAAGTQTAAELWTSLDVFGRDIHSVVQSAKLLMYWAPWAAETWTVGKPTKSRTAGHDSFSTPRPTGFKLCKEFAAATATLSSAIVRSLLSCTDVKRIQRIDRKLNGWQPTKASVASV